MTLASAMSNDKLQELWHDGEPSARLAPPRDP